MKECYTSALIEEELVAPLNVGNFNNVRLSLCSYEAGCCDKVRAVTKTCFLANLCEQVESIKRQSNFLFLGTVKTRAYISNLIGFFF